VTLQVYHVDAFADEVFKGNPARVCPLDEWLEDELMQNIAAEYNVSETAFFVKKDDDYHIRWFSPKKEVELCGHATLASAFILFNYIETETETITFRSKGGDLQVTKEDDSYTLIIDALMPVKDIEYVTLFNATIGEEPIQVYKGLDYILLYEKEETIRNIKPRFDSLKSLDLRGICITAKGDNEDFVYRFFAPKLGINEDYITGSACTSLAPLWAHILDKKDLSSFQLSERGSKIHCALIDNDQKVAIKGKAVLFSKGEIYLP
jgi:PhzF family phenazine biosynthesis protein